MFSVSSSGDRHFNFSTSCFYSLPSSCCFTFIASHQLHCIDCLVVRSINPTSLFCSCSSDHLCTCLRSLFDVVLFSLSVGCLSVCLSCLSMFIIAIKIDLVVVYVGTNINICTTCIKSLGRARSQRFICLSS